MKQINIECYSDATNNAVLRMPGRKYPGVLIQGDSLNALATLASELKKHAELTGSSAVIDRATELSQTLAERLASYERVMSEHGMSLPY